MGQAVAHANVVRTFSWFEPDDDAPFLAMELVVGVDLRELIALHGRLPWREACNYGFLAAVGLAALHAAGVVHRDVQPANLLIQRDGGLKIADFGAAAAAALLDSERPHESQWSASLSPYSPLPPEASEPSVLNDPRADVFSL